MQIKAPAGAPPQKPGLAKIGSIFAPVRSETLLAESEIQAQMTEPADKKRASRVSRVASAEKSTLGSSPILSPS